MLGLRKNEKFKNKCKGYVWAELESFGTFISFATASMTCSRYCDAKAVSSLGKQNVLWNWERYI